MADFKYYCDISDVTVELAYPQPMENSTFSKAFPGIAGFRYDGYHKLIGRSPDGRLLPVTRKIEFKRNPSLHDCNSKCINGKCNGVCECRCGGKNHGIGTFSKRGNK